MDRGNDTFLMTAAMRVEAFGVVMSKFATVKALEEDGAKLCRMRRNLAPFTKVMVRWSGVVQSMNHLMMEFLIPNPHDGV